jgi:hypothetical protein
MKTHLMALTTLAALVQPVRGQELRLVNFTSMSLAIGARHPAHKAPHHSMARLARFGEEQGDWRSIAASVAPLPALKLVAGYAERERGRAQRGGDTPAAWALGADYSIASGLFQLGYARNRSDASLAPNKRLSIAYEYRLASDAIVYADASRHHTEHGVRQFRIGLRASY